VAHDGPVGRIGLDGRTRRMPVWQKADDPDSEIEQLDDRPQGLAAIDPASMASARSRSKYSSSSGLLAVRNQEQNEGHFLSSCVEAPHFPATGSDAYQICSAPESIEIYRGLIPAGLSASLLTLWLARAVAAPSCHLRRSLARFSTRRAHRALVLAHGAARAPAADSALSLGSCACVPARSSSAASSA
jgi:hypothetical protein